MMLEQKRRDLLARFGLTGDTALQPVGSLSGGERCRAALARLAATDANFLVLDEPTNHLDLWARDALERALSRVRRHGAVRQPRPLLRQPRGRSSPGGRARAVPRHRRQLRHVSRPGRARAGPVARRGGAADRRRHPRRRIAVRAANDREDAQADAKKRRFPYRKVSDLEAEIFLRETQLEEAHAALALPETHRDGKRVRQIKQEIDAIPSRARNALRPLGRGDGDELVVGGLQFTVYGCRLTVDG